MGLGFHSSRLLWLWCDASIALVHCKRYSKGPYTPWNSSHLEGLCHTVWDLIVCVRQYRNLFLREENGVKSGWIAALWWKNVQVATRHLPASSICTTVMFWNAAKQKTIFGRSHKRVLLVALALFLTHFKWHLQWYNIRHLHHFM